MAAAEVEETIRRLSSHKGVEGILVSTYDGVALKSTLSAELSTMYAGLMSQLVLKARGAVRTIDAEVRRAGGRLRGGGAAGGWAVCCDTTTFLVDFSRLFTASFVRSSFTPRDAQNDLVFLRARTRKHEVMIAPGEGYVLVVRFLVARGLAYMRCPHPLAPIMNE